MRTAHERASHLPKASLSDLSETMERCTSEDPQRMVFDSAASKQTVQRLLPARLRQPRFQQCLKFRKNQTSGAETRTP